MINVIGPEILCVCGHEQSEHCQERSLSNDTDSKRELCLRCPGYENPGYPNGWCWHRFRTFTNEE